MMALFFPVSVLVGSGHTADKGSVVLHMDAVCHLCLAMLIYRLRQQST